MRILVIEPIGSDKWNESDKEMFASNASPGTEVDVVSLSSGPLSIETRENFAEVLPLVVRKGLEVGDEYDALIVNCFLDPGVDVLRSSIDKPVVGPCEASLAIAGLLGWRLAVVSISGGALPMIEERIRALGYGTRLVSLRGIGIPVLKLEEDLEATKEAVKREAEEALREGAEVIVLGCTGLAGISKDVEDEVGVPVIDPAIAALRMAEVLAGMELKQSRKRYY